MQDTRTVVSKARKNAKKSLKSSVTRGFTLVELLVVIGIIAALSAILLPVFFNARERARRTTCQSNQRQVAAAMHQYLQDYDGVYPHEMFAYNINGVSTLVSWHDVLFPYTKNREIFRCPGQGPAIPKLGLPADGYTLNDEWLNTFKWSGKTPGEGILTVRGRQESELVNTATIWLSGDRVAVENQHCVDCDSGTGSCGRDLYGSTLHGNGGNYSFLDGHVQWFTTKAMAELDCRNGPFPADSDH